jgi:hypothetical protein
VCAAPADHSAESQVPDDPARGLRRLLALLILLALVAAGGAFALSQRGSGASTGRQLPALFPSRFSEAGFLNGDAVLVASYDAAPTSRQTTATVTARGNVYVVVLCRTGTVRITVGSLTSSRPCTGSPDGVLALNLTQDVTLTATVTASQGRRWGVAIYR